MITLITGGPGTGKTAWLLDQLLELRKVEPNREFFIHGVRNLRGISHEQIFCRSQLCDICRSQDADIQAKEKSHNKPKFVENWPDWKPSGSLIVVDEVQRIWRPRSGGSVMPLGVSGLETHRHYGIDFWLISQGPHLFDNAIRLLVGRHVHLVSRWSGRTQYEWPECKQEVQSRTDAVNRPYTLPKRVYSMYDSAEVHTKQNKRKPISFYVTIVMSIVAVCMISFLAYRLKERVEPVKSVPVSGGVPPVSGSVSSVSRPPDSKLLMDTPEQIQIAMTPVVPGLPWSAPIYKDLNKPVSMPILSGCVQSKKPDDLRCLCYSQQGSIIDLSTEVCHLNIKSHTFNHFKPDSNNLQVSNFNNQDLHNKAR